ncbi:hypothetical protein GCM10027579_14720 [Calidifontibacter terrae]
MVVLFTWNGLVFRVIFGDFGLVSLTEMLLMGDTFSGATVKGVAFDDAAVVDFDFESLPQPVSMRAEMTPTVSRRVLRRTQNPRDLRSVDWATLTGRPVRVSAASAAKPARQVSPSIR